MTPVEEWTAAELFDYLNERDLLEEDADFENYKHDRTDMIDLVNQHLAE